MSLYELLGLSPGASAADVRRAHRRLARRYHPGLNPGDAEAARRYAELTRAFETLSDPVQRRRYDEGGETAAAPQTPDVAFAGFDFSVAVEGGAATTFGDLFADVFRAAAGSQRRPAPTMGADVHVQAVLTLADVVHGVRRTVQVARRLPCGSCGGAGRVERPAHRCGPCAGVGRVQLARGHMTFVRPCDTCGGAGVIRHWTCEACRGAGQQTRVEGREVVLPPGLTDGEEWRERGEGHAGPRGSHAGDLCVHVKVLPDSRIHRVGDDLHLALSVAVHEAVLGTRVIVETPDGPVRVRVPPGMQGGGRIRLRGRGVPSRRTGSRGDLVVTVQLVLPRVIDERGRELMREFARLHPDDVRQELDPARG